MRDGQPGSVTFVQRFGGILNLNPHFHSLALDGLFAPDPADPDGPLAYHALPTPDEADFRDLAVRLARRLGALARRRLEEAGRDPRWQDPARASWLSSAWDALHAPGRTDGHDDPIVRPLCARIDGFLLHAARTVSASDRAGLERLCRYGLRAPFSLDRLSLDPDGRVRCRLLRPWPNAQGRPDVVLEPLAFLRRLAALVPAPWVHMVRYHGVFANRSKFRKRLPPPPASARADTDAPAAATPAPPPPPAAPRPQPGPRACRLPWASLLRRVLDVDALTCPRCNIPLVVLAFLTDPPVVRRILVHLRLPADVPPLAPARPPECLDPQQDLDLAVGPPFIDDCDLPPDPGPSRPRAPP